MIIFPILLIASYNLSGALDITANPQIADGYDGQIIHLYHRDTDTMTLDDGTGLVLSGQFVMGQDDMITLIYYKGSDWWVEISRSDN